MDVGSVGSTPRLVTPSEPPAPTPSPSAAAQLQRKTEGQQSSLIKGWDTVVRSLEQGDKVEMEFDKDINRVVVRIVSGRTQETIAQYPSEELLSFMKKFGQYMSLSVEGV